MRKDRAAFAARTGYSGGVFDTPGLAWAKRAFIQPQFHPFDRFFYDRAAGNYTVDRALLPSPTSLWFGPWYFYIEIQLKSMPKPRRLKIIGSRFPSPVNTVLGPYLQD